MQGKLREARTKGKLRLGWTRGNQMGEDTDMEVFDTMEGCEEDVRESEIVDPHLDLFCVVHFVWCLCTGVLCNYKET